MADDDEVAGAVQGQADDELQDSLGMDKGLQQACQKVESVCEHAVPQTIVQMGQTHGACYLIGQHETATNPWLVGHCRKQHS